MRLGFERESAAMTLWFMAAFFCMLAVGLYKWPTKYGYELMGIGALIWVALMVFFLRVPSED